MKIENIIKITLFLFGMSIGLLHASEEAKYGVHDVLTDFLITSWISVADTIKNEALLSLAFSGFLGFHMFIYMRQWFASESKMSWLTGSYNWIKENPKNTAIIGLGFGAWVLGWKIYNRGQIALKQQKEQQIKTTTKQRTPTKVETVTTATIKED